MADYKEAFVGIDVAKLRNAIAIADAGREGEIRFFGEVDASAWSPIVGEPSNPHPRSGPGRSDCDPIRIRPRPLHLKAEQGIR